MHSGCVVGMGYYNPSSCKTDKLRPNPVPSSQIKLGMFAQAARRSRTPADVVGRWSASPVVVVGRTVHQRQGGRIPRRRLGGYAWVNVQEKLPFVGACPSRVPPSKMCANQVNNAGPLPLAPPPPGPQISHCALAVLLTSWRKVLSRAACVEAWHLAKIASALRIEGEAAVQLQRPVCPAGR